MVCELETATGSPGPPGGAIAVASKIWTVVGVDAAESQRLTDCTVSFGDEAVNPWASLVPVKLISPLKLPAAFVPDDPRFPKTTFVVGAAVTTVPHVTMTKAAAART